MIGSQTYSKSNNDIRVLNALWHPYSDCHVGILSSDSVFRYLLLFFILCFISFIYVHFIVDCFKEDATGFNVDCPVSDPGLCRPKMALTQNQQHEGIYFKLKSLKKNTTKPYFTRWGWLYGLYDIFRSMFMRFGSFMLVIEGKNVNRIGTWTV